MADQFSGLIHNKLLLVALAGWFIAQFIKLILHRVIQKEWKPERMVGNGGMPSSHSSTMCALVFASLRMYGAGSFEFCVFFILAIIVINDARGVRWETGKQAEVINNLLESIDNGEDLLEGKELKEFVGHTPFQVLVGSIIGTAVGLLFPL